MNHLFTAAEFNETAKAVGQVLHFIHITSVRMTPRERFFLSLGLRVSHAQEAARRGDPKRALVHKVHVQHHLKNMPRPVTERDKQLFHLGILSTRLEEALAYGETVQAKKIGLQLMNFIKSLAPKK